MGRHRNVTAAEFVIVNVVYKDGTRRSNCKVPRAALRGYADEEDIRRAIEEQERNIAEMSGQAPRPIASIVRVKER
jgi:hypothetical protein